MQDLPAGQEVTDLVQRPRDVLVQGSGPATAAEHDQAALVRLSSVFYETVDVSADPINLVILAALD